MIQVKSKKKIIILVTACFAVLFSVENVLAQLKIGKAVSFTSDGAWCWFQDPRAVYVKGAQARIYAQWMTSKGELQVGAMDLNSGETELYTLKENWDIDDHNVGAFLVLEDNRLMVFYARHNKQGLFCRTSTYPEDISRWEKEVVVSDEHRITYAHPVYLAQEEKFYVFWRGTSWKPTFSSSKDGENWSTPKILIQDEGKEGQEVRPYTKITSDGISSIHIAFTDGHPNREPHNSVYYLKYEAGQFSKADGSVVGGMSDLPIQHRASEVMYDAGINGPRAWVWDIRLDRIGNPTVAYSLFPTESDHRYRFSKWNGNAWVHSDVASGGSWFPQTPPGEQERETYYSGGISMDPGNQTTLYLSRQVEGAFELEQWKSRDNEETWEMESVTSQSTHLNVRPVVPAGLPEGMEIVLWMSGDYIHYTRYNTGINLMLLSK